MRASATLAVIAAFLLSALLFGLVFGSYYGISTGQGSSLLLTVLARPSRVAPGAGLLKLEAVCIAAVCLDLHDAGPCHRLVPQRGERVLTRRLAGVLGVILGLAGDALAGEANAPFPVGNTVYNVKHPTFGAKGDGAMDDTVAIQAAINAAGSTTYRGAVYLPDGQYNISAPLFIQKNSLTIGGPTIGNGTAPQGAVLRAQAGFNGPMFILLPEGETPANLRLTTALVTGSGQALTLQQSTQTFDTYIDFMDASVPLNGLTAFAIEVFFKATDLTRTHGNLVSSVGYRYNGEAGHTCFRLWVGSDGRLNGSLNIGGTVVSMASAASAVSAATVYHAALTYDGTTVRLFLGTAGGSSILQASQAASGTVSQVTYDLGSIGAEHFLFPDGGVYNDGLSGVIDSIRISKVARYTSNFTAPSAKLTSDSNTMLLENWDHETLYFSILQANSQTQYVPKRTPYTGAGISQVHLHDLTLLGNTPYGMGLFGKGVVNNAFERLTFAGFRDAVHFYTNPYLNSFNRINVVNGGRAGMILSNASGITALHGPVELAAVPYPLIWENGSGIADTLFVHGNYEVGLLLRTGQYAIHGAFLSNEDTSTSVEVAAVISSQNDTMLLQGGKVEAFHHVMPALIEDGDGVLTVIGTLFQMNAGASQVINQVTVPTVRAPRALNVNITNGVPISLGSVTSL